MALTASAQAEVERIEMRFETATLTFTSTNASGNVTHLHADWGEPDFIRSNTQFAAAAENEEILTIDSHAAGVSVIQRDGHGALVDGAVYKVLFIWI